MADKVKEVAVEEAERIKLLASEAARSGAYLYPLRVRCLTNFGVYFLNKHSANLYPVDFSTGHRILSVSPLLMEAVDIKACTQRHLGGWDYHGHVHFYFPPADGSNGVHQWTPCATHSYAVGAQRKLNRLYHPKQNISVSRCHGGHFRWSAGVEEYNRAGFERARSEGWK